MIVAQSVTFPLRPINGGPWEHAKRFPKPGTWQYEPKYNGWRAMVHTPTGAMFNRRNMRLSIESEFTAALRALCATLDAEGFKWVDVEALERRHGIGKGCLVVLDVVPEPIYGDATYDQRRDWLSILPTLPLRPPRDFPLLSIPPNVQPDAAWEELQRINREFDAELYEGLVAKRTDSRYVMQMRSADQEFPGWVKHRWAF